MTSIHDADLDVHSLRVFIAVADEASFTRAADRLLIAQQAVSRTVRRLEDRLGTRLFVRTTRQVTLTPEGQRFLEQARRLVALHDEIVGDLAAPARPLVVDLLSEGRRTGPRILEALRLAVPDVEFRARFGGGVGVAARLLVAGDLDLAFGRAEWVGGELPGGLEHHLVRLEPLALMLPAGHPLAERERVPMSDLAGVEIDVNPAHPEAPDWTDLARQLLDRAGAVATPPHLPAVGKENQADHLVRQGLPILTGLDHEPVPGGVIRPIAEPVPLFPWSVIWPRRLHRSLVAAVQDATGRLARDEGWLERPDDAWLPEPEASTPAKAKSAGPPQRTRREDGRTRAELRG
jgi:DNA-binding transcriptional LysR family regulator